MSKGNKITHQCPTRKMDRPPAPVPGPPPQWTGINACGIRGMRIALALKEIQDPGPRPRTEDPGTRTKVQVPRSEDRGLRSQVRGPRTQDPGPII